MIKVTSASDLTEFYINHKKLELIKTVGNNIHITLDTGNTYIVTDSIEHIREQILKFDSKTLHTALIKNIEQEEGVLINE